MKPILIFLIIASFTMEAQTMWQVNNNTSTKWMLQSHEEFDKGSSPSLNKPINGLDCEKINTYYIDIRFKTNFKNQSSGSILLNFKKSNQSISLAKCDENKMKEFIFEVSNTEIYTKKIYFKDNYGEDFNIISAKIENQTLSYYVNNINILDYKPWQGNCPFIDFSYQPKSSKEFQKMEAPFVFDYIRIWVPSDTNNFITESYKKFEQSNNNIQNGKIYSIDPILKRKLFANKKKCLKDGTLTLLPIFYNKYSLSILGKNLGKIQVDIFDNQNIKVAGYNLENINYYVLDLSNLPTGGYIIKINLLNQVLTHQLSVINPEKIGEE